VNKIFWCAVTALLAVASAGAEVSLTVYNQNIALVKDAREVSLKKGVQRIEFDDVAAQINPSSVHFRLPDSPAGFSVLEQNFEYDLVSREKLLQKYIGRDIDIERRVTGSDRKEVLHGTLLSVSDGLTVQSGDKILLNPQGEVQLSKLPEGLILKPTLSLVANSSLAGSHALEIGYLTGGINWNADYVVISDNHNRTIDLTGWVTVDNRSGAVYPDARLKLVAGDIHRLPQNRDFAMNDIMEKHVVAAASPQFEEKAFFEYHLYTLNRKTTLKDNETKQIEFTSATNVPVKKLYRYDGGAQPFSGYYERVRIDRGFGTASNKKVSVILQFKNAKDKNLGIPLPRGNMRIYQRDDDGSLEFIGEDAIDHTPENEEVNVSLGDAFDIVGERSQTDFRCGSGWCEESFSITLRNHKKDASEVRVVEHLNRWSNWKITANSDEFKKDDARTISFTAPVPANGTKTITYSVKYWW
jgi:hypothetical protein